MDKKWVRKSVDLVWILVVGVFMLCVMMGCDREKEDADLFQWQKKSSTAVASQTYRDSEGNQIVYYCCKTTYYEQGEKTEDGTLDRRTLSAVVDWNKMEESRDCTVGHWPALLCQCEGRSYLCWTISPEYSCVIEYDADVVSEEDIFHMAESVVQR